MVTPNQLPSAIKPHNGSWREQIAAAIGLADPAESNRSITAVHYRLGCALSDAIGAECGANFHSWAVWGSRKAGYTIRQEDLDQALRDATTVAGIAGAAIGAAAGYVTLTFFSSPLLATAFGATLGALAGAPCGRKLARWSRRRASELVLEGNRTVLEDIGNATGAYLDAVASGEPTKIAAFLASFRPGDTVDGGQDLLAEAFTRYESARVSSDPKRRQEDTFFANCLAVLHEHFRLDAYIRASMPRIVRRCVTKRLMTFEIGKSSYSVSADAPTFGETPFPPSLMEISDPRIRQFLFSATGWGVKVDGVMGSSASDWTRLRQRMAYVFQLFLAKHTDPEVFSAP